MNKFPVNQALRGLRTIFIILTSIALLAGCKSIIKPSNPYLSEQEAIDAATKLAASSRPEISGAQATPSNIVAQQLTLDEALKKINKGNQIPTGYDAQMTVWFVTMDGLWLGEMATPGIVPTPQPVLYHHFAVIPDAKTGSEIESSISL